MTGSKCGSIKPIQKQSTEYQEQAYDQAQRNRFAKSVP
jgi:hypothetical protein